MSATARTRMSTVARTAASATVLACTVVAGCAADPTSEAEPACDRQCLIATMDGYLAAVVAHDPSAVPLSKDIRFVENLQRMSPGEGLWQTATGGPTGFAIPVPDVELQQIGWLGVIEMEGKPLMLAVRLKLDGDTIVEAEHLGVPPSAGSEDRISAPRAAFKTEIPPRDRLPHDELLGIGATYYDAVDNNDGSLSPLARDCVRHENGRIASGARALPIIPEKARPGVSTDCVGQIDSQALQFIAAIDGRRMIAADPVTGLVMGLAQFRLPFDNLPYEVMLSDGTMAERNAQNLSSPPVDIAAAHVFKIGPEGQIHEIEAIGLLTPLNSKTGWEE